MKNETKVFGEIQINLDNFVNYNVMSIDESYRTILPVNFYTEFLLKMPHSHYQVTTENLEMVKKKIEETEKDIIISIDFRQLFIIEKTKTKIEKE